MPRRALVTGATGFVGGRLASALADRDWEVRCLVRDRSRARELADRGFEPHEQTCSIRRRFTVPARRRGGLLPDPLDGPRGGGRLRGARTAKRPKLRRDGETRGSRPGRLPRGPRRPPAVEAPAQPPAYCPILSELGPPLTYFRAGMVVGAHSESYRTLRYLVQRLPAMIGPAWLAKPTQPIGIDDVIAYLEAAPDVPASEGREVQIGGPDVPSYGECWT